MHNRQDKSRQNVIVFNPCIQMSLNWMKQVSVDKSRLLYIQRSILVRSFVFLKQQRRCGNIVSEQKQLFVLFNFFYFKFYRLYVGLKEVRTWNLKNGALATKSIHAREKGENEEKKVCNANGVTFLFILTLLF